MLLQVYVLRAQNKRVAYLRKKTDERSYAIILVNLATSASEHWKLVFPRSQKIENMVSLNNGTRTIYQLEYILNSHKERTNKHTRSLVDLANEFSDRNDNRRRNLILVLALKKMISVTVSVFSMGYTVLLISILIDAPFIHRLYRLGVTSTTVKETSMYG